MKFSAMKRGTLHNKKDYHEAAPNTMIKTIEAQATTYSPAKRIAVPSALKGLTSGFGMGPGGPPSQLSRGSRSVSKSAVPLSRVPLVLQACIRSGD